MTQMNFKQNELRINIFPKFNYSYARCVFYRVRAFVRVNGFEINDEIKMSFKESLYITNYFLSPVIFCRNMKFHRD